MNFILEIQKFLEHGLKEAPKWYAPKDAPLVAAGIDHCRHILPASFESRDDFINALANYAIAMVVFSFFTESDS